MSSYESDLEGLDWSSSEDDGPRAETRSALFAAIFKVARAQNIPKPVVVESKYVTGEIKPLAIEKADEPQANIEFSQLEEVTLKHGRQSITNLITEEPPLIAQSGAKPQVDINIYQSVEEPKSNYLELTLNTDLKQGFSTAEVESPNHTSFPPLIIKEQAEVESPTHTNFPLPIAKEQTGLNDHEQEVGADIEEQPREANEIEHQTKFEIPQSEEEARAHVEEIRCQQDEGLKSMQLFGYEELLKMISGDLYTDSMHFLIELLQNADDNFYIATYTPTVKIRYKNRFLLFECNEIGFSRTNVSSICTTARSSKKKNLNTKDIPNPRSYIGEKGIGFKAVFKVAQRVWINSGYYTFRFDRDAEIGAIRPIWDPDLPLPKTDGFSAIVIELGEKVNSATIIEGITVTDPTMLMFLQKLKRLEIDLVHTNTTQNKQVILEASRLPDRYGVLFSPSLRRNNCDLSPPCRALRYLIDNISTSISSDSDHRRLTCEETDIILVFSIDTASPRTKMVYAFLPIRTFGFKFDIQADFLLTSNRQDIQDNLWNQNIVQHIPSAILKAVQLFNEENKDLKYNWPLLLPSHVPQDSIFGSLPQEIVRILSRNKVLENTDKEIVIPSDLVYVPQRFKDKTGTPLLRNCYSSQKSLLSDKYPQGVINYLKELGVENMDDEYFLANLEILAEETPTEFQQMPFEWHDAVCKILSLQFSNYKFEGRIKNMKLVPLKNGTWVSSDPDITRCLYHGDQKNLPFPNNIRNVVEIDPKVKGYEGRVKLLEQLGAKVTGKKGVCELILEFHKLPWTKPEQLLAADVVHHLDFLYRAGWQVQNLHSPPPDLWCVGIDEKIYRGSEVYLTSKLHYSASVLFSNSKTKLQFLHPYYIERLGDTPNVHRWLEQSLGTTSMLRIKEPYTSILTPHKDFLAMCRDEPQGVLMMLRERWRNCAVDFEDSELGPYDLKNQGRKNLRDQVSNMTVLCQGGHRWKLKETCLLTPRLRALCQNMPLVRLLDIPDPENARWRFLSIFGVILQPDIKFFLSRLEDIQDICVVPEQLINIYQELSKYKSEAEQSMIRRVLLPLI
ncbi:hypothetical protein ABW20_dc0100255 [Dactylellina cionopaga]|nr:hypothetical protein ABW20_dc0100255 [Dactylellina cionopaga]